MIQSIFFRVIALFFLLLFTQLLPDSSLVVSSNVNDVQLYLMAAINFVNYKDISKKSTKAMLGNFATN